MLHVLALWLLSLVVCAPAVAQLDCATITGTVTAPSGAAVPGVHVLVRSTGAKFEAETTEAGQHNRPGLLIGNYEVSFDAQGFKLVGVESINRG
jgi:hypothetical protein